MALDKIGDLEYFINKSIDEGATLMSVNTYAPNPSNINPQREKDNLALETSTSSGIERALTKAFISSIFYNFY